MRKMSRRHGSRREDDGAIDCNSLLLTVCRDFQRENAGRWSNPEWLDLLQEGSDKKSVQHCLNSDGLILDMRAIQGHSGGAQGSSCMRNFLQMERVLLSRCLCPLHALHHSIRIDCRKNRCKRGDGRQTVFFTGLDPVSDEPQEEYQEL